MSSIVAQVNTNWYNYLITCLHNSDIVTLFNLYPAWQKNTRCGYNVLFLLISLIQSSVRKEKKEVSETIIGIQFFWIQRRCPLRKNLIWFYLISSDFIWSHLRIIWSSDFSSDFLISQMRILFSHMSLRFSHITSDAHLISNMIFVSQVNSHVLKYDLRWSDDFLILPVFSD